jgi:transposase
MDRDLNAAINLQHYPEFQGKLSLWRAKTTGVANKSKTEFVEEGILHKADNCSVQLETFIS